MRPLRTPDKTGGPSRRAAALSLLLRLLLGGVFLYAAALKWPAPRAFAEDIANYRLLPAALVAPAAEGMLGVETVLGLSLLVGRLRREAAWLALLLLFLFTVAVGSALQRGLKIECGCFGAGGSPATIMTLYRDLALCAAAGLLLWLEERRVRGEKEAPAGDPG